MTIHSFLASSSLFSLIVATPSFALVEQSSADSIQEIIVTGSKMEQSLKNAPMSVTVFDRETIEKAGMKTLRDIDDYAPNVSITQIGQVGGTYISIRGIESNPFILNRTAVYVDGIPYRDPDMMRLHDANQIEILRGPQGTLYGSNADAGLIVISTKTPTDEFAASVGGGVKSFGNGQTYSLNSSISGGIADHLTAIMNVEYEKGDSYIRNVASSLGLEGEIENIALSGKLRYEPSLNTQLDVVAFYNELNAPGLYEQEFPALDVDVYNAVYGEAFNGGIQVGDFELVNDAPKKTHENEWSIGAALRHDFTNFTWHVSGTYRTEDEETYGTDLDLTAAALSAGAGDGTNTYWNIESRLAASDAANVDWVIGATFYKDKKSRTLGTLVGPGSYDDFNRAPEQRTNSQDWAVFGQLVVPLTDRLNVSGGLRFEHAKRIWQQDEGALDLGSLGVFAYPAVDETSSNDAWVPKFSIDYALTQEMHIYASATKGYLPGGFNIVAADQGSDIVNEFGPYGAEKLWSYEVGAKGHFMDGKMFASAAVFYIDAQSWQEYNILTAPNGQVLSTSLITSNAAIESKGFEIEVIASPTDALSIATGFGYIDATYSDYVFSPTQDFTDNKVKLVPEFDFTLNATYAFAEGWYLRSEAQAIGQTPLNRENTASRDTVWLFGVSAGYETEQWSIRGYAKNLTNERYAAGLAYLNFLFGDDGTFYAPLANPRVIGLELSWKL
jgi:iron complex outermembrane receptor protein